MIKIKFLNNSVECFDIYFSNDDCIVFKDFADNFIKISKIDNTTYIYINNEYVKYDANIESYEIL